MEHRRIMFFSDKWSMKDDNKFIDHLVWFTRTEKKMISRSKREIFKLIQKWLNPRRMSNGKETIMPEPVYTLADIYRRYDLAEQRYQTWKQIISHDGVQYNAAGNTIQASKKTLAEICEMYTYGRAYLFEPEYKWNELQVIFGPYGEGNHAGTQGGGYSQLLEEMLSEMGREAEVGGDEAAADSYGSGQHQPPVLPPDVFSTTKGKGRVINEEDVKWVAQGVKQNEEKGDISKDKPTPSGGSKRFLDF